MHQIVYVSTARGPFDPDAVLTPARAFNATRGVTGLLLHAHDTYLQVLEGDESDVEAAYERVASSTRHTGLRRTPALPLERRHFPEWHMGFEHAAPTQVVQRLLQPLVDHGCLDGTMVRGVLLARFAALSSTAASR